MLPSFSDSFRPLHWQRCRSLDAPLDFIASLFCFLAVFPSIALADPATPDPFTPPSSPLPPPNPLEIIQKESQFLFPFSYGGSSLRDTVSHSITHRVLLQADVGSCKAKRSGQRKKPHERRNNFPPFFFKINATSVFIPATRAFLFRLSTCHSISNFLPVAISIVFPVTSILAQIQMPSCESTFCFHSAAFSCEASLFLASSAM